MKSKNFKLFYFIIALSIMVVSSCNKEKMFKQPTIEVLSFSLTELPNEYAHLTVDVKVINNDKRDATITDAEYTVEVEGYTTEKENVDINQKIGSDPLELSLPITLKTDDALQLLTKLDAGQTLEYNVTGTFHVSDPVLKRFDWPINVQGETTVDAGFEDFYKQPNIVVDDMEWTYSIEGLTSYKFNIDVNCTVTNMDARSAEIDEVEYTVNIEGVDSETHLYSDSYSNNINIAGNETITLVLPVTLNLDPTSGLSLSTALLDGTADYIIEGTFHTVKVEGESADFKLPLYETGNVTVSQIVK